MATPEIAFPGFGQVTDLGANWRIKFYDADGIPLSMLSFEEIDFGAIAYKEIFQNVKTILATPLYSCALERLLGVDQRIVDLPIGEAAHATVAVMDALYFWEPRVEIVDIGFASDVISGHLVCSLKLRIKNVIYGSDTPYDRNNISGTTPQGTYQPTLKTWQEVEPRLEVVVQRVPMPMPGPQGAAGERGSWWFQGVGAPSAVAGAKAMDMYLDDSNGDVYQFDGFSWRKRV